MVTQHVNINGSKSINQHNRAPHSDDGRVKKKASIFALGSAAGGNCFFIALARRLRRRALERWLDRLLLRL